jgi:hypothetical protein
VKADFIKNLIIILTVDESSVYKKGKKQSTSIDPHTDSIRLILRGFLNLPKQIKPTQIFYLSALFNSF